MALHVGPLTLSGRIRSLPPRVQSSQRISTRRMAAWVCASVSASSSRSLAARQRSAADESWFWISASTAFPATASHSALETHRTFAVPLACLLDVDTVPSPDLGLVGDHLDSRPRRGLDGEPHAIATTLRRRRDGATRRGANRIMCVPCATNADCWRWLRNPGCRPRQRHGRLKWSSTVRHAGHDRWRRPAAGPELQPPNHVRFETRSFHLQLPP